MKTTFGTIASVLVGSCIAATSDATIIELELGQQVVSVNPADNVPTTSSTLPIGVLRFEDIGPQQVLFTFASSLESPGELFLRVVFNGVWDRPDHIGFALQSTSGMFGIPSFGRSSNGSGTGPPAGFDFNLTFSTPGFDGTDSITYLLTCAVAVSCGPSATGAGRSPLDATDFNVTNADASGNPGYTGWFAVGNIRYPGSDSNGARYGDSLAVDNVVTPLPEPGILATIGAGILSLVFARPRHRRVRESRRIGSSHP